MHQLIPSHQSLDLTIDCATEVARIENAIQSAVFHILRRRGVVVGVSGGIDSSVVAFLCARALGNHRVLALFTPEADSSPDSLRLGRSVAKALGIESVEEDITPILTGARCYERRDASIRRIVPEYGEGWKSKIALPQLAAHF